MQDAKTEEQLYYRILTSAFCTDGLKGEIHYSTEGGDRVKCGTATEGEYFVISQPEDYVLPYFGIEIS